MKLRSMLGIGVFCVVGLVNPAAAMDWIGMADQYGNNVQNIMRTESFNQMRNNTIAQQRGMHAPQRSFSWPAHINASSVQRGHVFTVDELEAMYRSDPERTRQLLSGRQVTVQGVAEWRLFRGDERGTLRLNPEVGREYFVGVRGDLPRNAFNSGDRIRLQGVPEYERRNHVTLRNSRLLVANVPQSATRATASAASTADKVTAGPGSLKFRPNEATRKQANALLVERLKPALRQGVSPNQLQQVLAGGELQQTFARVSRQHGFATDDLADVLTVAMVLGWQVANDVPNVDEPSGYRALRRDLAQALTQSGWVARMDNDQKQMVAELTGTGMMMIVMRYHEGRTQGQTALVRQSGEDAQRFLRELTGMDVKKMKLTSQGLVSR